MTPPSDVRSPQDVVYGEAVATDGAAIDRLARAYEPSPDRRPLLYLEDLDSASIAEITGFSPGNVATKIHRIKALLARRFREGTR